MPQTNLCYHSHENRDDVKLNIGYITDNTIILVSIVCLMGISELKRIKKPCFCAYAQF